MSFDSSAENYLKSSDHSYGSDLDYFREYFKNISFTTALDVACAAGHFAKIFNCSERIVTTDFSFNMLKTARGSMGFDMPVQSKAEFLPFKKDSFDLVGCRIAMHHFRNPCMFMGEAYRVLKKEGWFALIDSVVGSEDKYLNEIELIRDESHHRSFQAEEITGMAEAEGFSVEKIKIFRKKHNFEEWAKRLNPSEEQYINTINAFKALPEKIKSELEVVIKSGKVISYTDKKCLFIFRKQL
jgi:ubiquinone/menaquinone biosynthesis C-methylase UbiE